MEEEGGRTENPAAEVPEEEEWTAVRDRRRGGRRVFFPVA